MDKVLGTFYKGNAERFGLGAWNSVKDDFIEISKSQNIKQTFIYNDSSNIYIPQKNDFQKYNHFSPNLIRMQYFNDNLKEIEHRRNLYLQDYMKNDKYNVYYNQIDPLFDRRRNVQTRLENVKNKLINEEKQKLIRKHKKIEKENKLIEDLILENEKSPNDEFFRMIEYKDNNFDKDLEFEKEEINSEKLSNNYSDKKSILVLSRTSSNDNSSSYNDNFDLILMNQDNMNNITNKSFYTTKTKKNPKKRASISSTRNSISQNRKKHTDILRVMMNIEKYSVPKDNASNELLYQNKEAGEIFNEIYNDIKHLKKDFNQRLSQYNEKTKNNINMIKDILNLCDNNNMKRSVDNIFYRNGQKKLKIDKNYLDSEVNNYKEQIENSLDKGINNFLKEEMAQDFDIKLKNEPIYMESDFNLRIKGNERSKYGLIYARILNNKIEKMPDIKIKAANLGDESVKEFSSSDSIKSDLFTFSNNSKNNLFPALHGLKEKISTTKNSETEIKNIVKSTKKKKKKKRKQAFIKDLEIVEENYEGHKDNKKGRKETMLYFRNDNEIKKNKINDINLDNKNAEDSLNTDYNNSKNGKINKKKENENKKDTSKSKKESKRKSEN